MTLRDIETIPVKDNFETHIPTVANWNPRYMGRGIVRYNYQSGTNTTIAQTGSNIATAFNMTGSLHKILSAWIVVATSAGNVVDNTGPNTLTITHQNYVATVNEVIWANANTATGSFQALFDSATDDVGQYAFRIGFYILNTNCPNGDLVSATFEVYFPDWRDYEEEVQPVI